MPLTVVHKHALPVNATQALSSALKILRGSVPAREARSQGTRITSFTPTTQPGRSHDSNPLHLWGNWGPVLKLAQGFRG